jgi:hypothetical protein
MQRVDAVCENTSSPSSGSFQMYHEDAGTWEKLGQEYVTHAEPTKTRRASLAVLQGLVKIPLESKNA